MSKKQEEEIDKLLNMFEEGIEGEFHISTMAVFAEYLLTYVLIESIEGIGVDSALNHLDTIKKNIEKSITRFVKKNPPLLDRQVNLSDKKGCVTKGH